MNEDRYILKNGKKLRLGYTTGSCAAAACKAAAEMLFSGTDIYAVHLLTPAGIPLLLDVHDIWRDETLVSCGILKDGGDDPDITSGLFIYGQVELLHEPGIQITGGEGVGRITKPGLNQPVGAPAINSVPLQMITEALTEVCQKYHYDKGLRATIRVPGGEATAKKTFNPRLGILGGISILGTTGIVEPMSDKAITDTIEIEIKQQALAGRRILLLMPGNYGVDFIRRQLMIDPENGVKCSNFIGDSLDLARALDFTGVLLVGHIGKLVKLAGGIMNTHSRYGDCRSEILMARSALAGADKETLEGLADAVTTEEMLALLAAGNCLTETMEKVLEQIHFHMNGRCQGTLKAGAILFANNLRSPGYTEYAPGLLEELKKEIGV